MLWVAAVLSAATLAVLAAGWLDAGAGVGAEVAAVDGAGAGAVELLAGAEGVVSEGAAVVGAGAVGAAVVLGTGLGALWLTLGLVDGVLGMGAGAGAAAGAGAGVPAVGSVWAEAIDPSRE